MTQLTRFAIDLILAFLSELATDLLHAVCVRIERAVEA